jgi:phage protein D
MGLGIAIEVDGTADAELANATWVEVCERMGEMTTYRIRYDFDVQEGDFPMLTDGRIDAGSELSIVAPADGQNNYLVKGPVTGQQIHFEHGSGGSYVEVVGSDSSVKMDRESKSTLWSDVTDSDAVITIVGQYNYTPDVDSTQAGHPESKHTLVQQDSDFRFVRRLAKRNGCLFWVTAADGGEETAHFKRPPVGGSASPDLIINLDTNNLDSLDLTWDAEQPTSVDAAQLDLNDKSSIDGAVAQSPLASLGAQSLSDIASGTRSVHVLAPVDDAGDLNSRSEGTLIDAGWFLHANTTTSVKAVGSVVRAHTLVNLRGAGKRHSGKYFVAAVRHTIDLTGHRMEIDLVRNGWGN